MLIQSDRHTAADLELWKEYEEIDAMRAGEQRLIEKENSAAAWIREFAKLPCYLGVSWGKDSVVTADIALRNGVDVPLVHLFCVPSHNLECDKVRNAFLRRYPRAGYREIGVDYRDIYAQNLPDCEQDRLTDIEWYKGFREAGDLFGHRHISGVRGKESQVRTLRMKRWGVSTDNTCAPIGYWSTDDVYAYLCKYDLPVHPNYAMFGGGRWPRERLRVAEIGDIHGNGGGRYEWEREYYPDVLSKISSSAPATE